jgi:hypothetical protein
MPHLSCRTCGRRIYSVAPLSSMTADELRCPRCGTPMQEDRRGPERRMTIRRENPPDVPGPPPVEGDVKGKKGAAAERPERRSTDRRTDRRRGGKPTLPGEASDQGGWQD